MTRATVFVQGIENISFSDCLNEKSQKHIFTQKENNVCHVRLLVKAPVKGGHFILRLVPYAPHFITLVPVRPAA